MDSANLLPQLIKLLPNITYIRSVFSLGSMQSELSLCLYAYNNLINESNSSSASNARSLTLISAVQDKLYEIINTGHWCNVDDRHRQAYTISVFIKVLHLLRGGTQSADKCLYELDMGLLLGCSLDGDNGNLLNKAIDLIGHHQSTGGSAWQAKRQKIDVPPQSFQQSPDIDALVRPSVDRFKCEYFDCQTPVILKHCIDHWPAMERWHDPSYLISVAGDRTVPIEIGQNYTSDEWSQDLVKFRNFIERQYTTGSDHCNRIEYLAQHNLFDQITALRTDIRVPEYCCLSTAAASSVVTPDIKAWLGPIGTVSPMHYDPKHNLLCQVVGMKRIILAAPKDTDNLYPHPGEMLKNTSQIDADRPDYERFPLVKTVKFYSLILNEGDMLYIPMGWWHYVRSLSKSFSVSFWWE